MKPTKKRVYCVDANKPKIVFASKRKADNFIKYNAEEIMAETGKSPVRSYYCPVCRAWHVTSLSLQCAEQRKVHFQTVVDNNVLKGRVRKTRNYIKVQLQEFHLLLTQCKLSEAETIINQCNTSLTDIKPISRYKEAFNTLFLKVRKAQNLLGLYSKLFKMDSEELQSFAHSSDCYLDKDHMKVVLKHIHICQSQAA